MPELYPTPTRLQLLAQIANDQVLTDITRDDNQDVILLFPDAPTSWQDRIRVTARVRELEHAGWAAEFERGPTWSLTDAGRAILDHHRPEADHG